MLAAAKQEIIAGKGGKEVEEYGSRYDPTDYQIYRRMADLMSEQHEAQQQQAAS